MTAQAERCHCSPSGAGLAVPRPARSSAQRLGWWKVALSGSCAISSISFLKARSLVFQLFRVDSSIIVFNNIS